MFAGAVTGNGLWTIGKQPLCVFDANFGCSPQHDTLRLARETSSSITAGASVTYFSQPAFGLPVDPPYVRPPLPDACPKLFSHAGNPHQQLRARNQGASQSTGAVVAVLNRPG